MKKGFLHMSHINNDWYWTWSDDGESISMRKLKWFERIIYWKFPDKLVKK